ncbi:unnamed protein product [Lactuca saligna]|uniref:Uncharacterized protein n=1 Tax=Lactuca saligna TaxID=75948 RepID=A0AA36DZ31_LACSI|nr:unnamed protein product [Lactuca saligna]
MPPLKTAIRCKKSNKIDGVSTTSPAVSSESMIKGGEPDAGGDKVTEDLPLKIDDLQHGSENVDQDKQGSGINGPQLETVSQQSSDGMQVKQVEAQIRFFHKMASRLAPVTGGKKLISGVLEAKRPTISQLHDKSRMEANIVFLEQHKGLFWCWIKWSSGLVCASGKDPTQCPRSSGTFHLYFLCIQGLVQCFSCVCSKGDKLIKSNLLNNNILLKQVSNQD